MKNGTLPLILGAIVVAILSLSCGGGSPGETPYSAGLEFQRQELCYKAIAEFDKTIKLDPKYAEAYHRRGMCYAQTGEYYKSLVDFGKAIDLNPFFTQAYGNRGTVESILGKYQLALNDHDKLVSLDPTALGYFFRGTDHLRLGNLQKAVSDFTQSLELLPRLQCVHNNRGVALHKLELYDNAVADFGYELDIYPDYPITYLNSAESQRLLKKYEQAVSDFTKVIDSDSSDVGARRGSAYTGRGLSYLMLKKQKDAEADFAKGIEFGEDPEEQKALINGQEGKYIELFVCDLFDISG
ncbi:MAG: tetratricopeptide repeat protein [Dehalococcoidia bacterium]|nr:tetratricopeptide repeat protein [Dehalococcoidia bacterium]